jgi:hypothetical protein
VRDVYHNLSPATLLEVSNPAPEFQTVTFLPIAGAASLSMHISTTDPALVYTKVYASQTPNFTPTAANLVYQGPNLTINLNVSSKGVWYVKMIGVDDFGEFGAITSPEYTPDVTPPGLATNLVATPMIKSIKLTWANPGDLDFDHVEIWQGSVNNSALATRIAVTANNYYTVDNLPPAASTLYFWLKSVDTSLNTSAFNTAATSGTSATTLSEVDYMVTSLANRISASELNTVLGARINLIDGDSTVAGSVNNRIQAEATARGTAITNASTTLQTATSSLAQQVALITAGSSTGFDAGQIWYFDTTVEGWTATTTAPTWVNGAINLADTQFISPTGLTAAGATYPIVKLRVTRTAGSGWTGNVYYATAGHSFSSTYMKTLAAPSGMTIGTAVILDFDMSTITDWSASTITQLRLDLGATSADTFLVDWVAIGRYAPASASAGILTEQTARIAADTSIASTVTALSAVVNDTTTGLPKARADIATLQSTSITSSNIAAAVETSLSTSSTITGLNTAIATNVSSINGMQGQYTVKIDNNGYVSGFGLLSTANNGTVVSDFSIRADSFSITNPAVAGKVGAVTPFSVLSTSETVNGTVYPAGVYMDKAMIKYLDASQINTNGLSIRDVSGNIILAAGNPLDFANVGGTTKPAANATRGASFGVDISGQITATNITTYMAGAAIQNAQIANLAVHTGNIDNLAVDTLKVAGNAVAFTITSTFSAIRFTGSVPSGGSSVWVTITSVTISLIGGTANSTAALFLKIATTPALLNSQANPELRILDSVGTVVDPLVILNSSSFNMQKHNTTRTYFIQARHTDIGNGVLFDTSFTGSILMLGVKSSV